MLDDCPEKLDLRLAIIERSCRTIAETRDLKVHPTSQHVGAWAYRCKSSERGLPAGCKPHRAPGLYEFKVDEIVNERPQKTAMMMVLSLTQRGSWIAIFRPK